MKLLNVDTMETAREKVYKMLDHKGMETIKLDICEAVGSILAEDIYAAEPIPGFTRSTVDGYAVIPAETSGASDILPVFLKIAGEVEMGKEPACNVTAGECMYVPTGGMVPQGASAVVMEEYCELFSETEIAVYKAAAEGENIIQQGDDMQEGALVITRGTRLRPQEIGALAAIGITEVVVWKPWSITIISTGDELVSPKEYTKPGQVRDINTFAIMAQAKKMQLDIHSCHVLKDERALLKKTVKDAMANSDIVVISGGSSQGKKDETCSVVDELASEGAFTHGLALKPGKPTIIGYDKPSRTVLAGLPGHPAAAMIVFELLIGHVWRVLSGEKEPLPLQAKLSVNIAAAPGRMTCQLVHLEKNEEGQLMAVPVFGRSGLISVLTKSDGYVLLEENQEGMERGETVEVYPL